METFSKEPAPLALVFVGDDNFEVEEDLSLSFPPFMAQASVVRGKGRPVC